MPDTAFPIIVQATNIAQFSDRLLKDFHHGRSVLGYLLERLTARWPGRVILATSGRDRDDSLVAEAERYGVEAVRGSFSNLVSRLLEAAESLGCDRFVRVNASYPLVDLRAMAKLAEAHVREDVEFSFNEHRDGVPWGTGCEVIEAALLRRLAEMELGDDQLEFPSLFVRQDPDAFRILRQDSPHARPGYKLAYETDKDLKLLSSIAAEVPAPELESVLAWLDERPFAAESNMESPPKEVGLEKLFLHPGKIAALHNGGELDPSYPVSVELTLTNRCNLRCVWCSDAELRERQGVGQDLDRETLFRLFDDLKAGGTRGVVIEGGGEPTVYEGFKDIIARLREIDLPVGMITNGTAALDAETAASFEWIRVSLDASTPQEFMELKGRTRYEDILSNIAVYARHCPTVGIGYVVTTQNITNLEALVLRARQYGVSYIQFRPVVDCPNLYPEGLDLSYLKRYETHRFSVIIDGMRENATSGNEGLPCLAHSLTTVISGDGSVYICGRLNIHDWLEPIGNIRTQDFKDIWSGAVRTCQAAQVADPAFCSKHCPQCRLTKFNVLCSRLSGIRTPNFI